MSEEFDGNLDHLAGSIPIEILVHIESGFSAKEKKEFDDASEHFQEALSKIESRKKEYEVILDASTNNYPLTRLDLLRKQQARLREEIEQLRELG